MEVVDVEAIPLERGLEGRFANSQRWYDSREYCVVRIELDDGTTGWGECYGPIAGTRELIERDVGPWLLGRDPRDVRAIHADLVFKLRASYHTFVPATVVSGVDMACWDAWGRAVGEPVSRLLGGRVRDSVRAYATGHYFRDVDDFEALRSIIVEEALGHVEAGFDALKNKIGLAGTTPWGPAEDVELVRAIREAVGDDVRLMTDANCAYDLPTARWVGDRLADLDVYWFEEPIAPTNVEGYARLNRALDVALAGGETWAFAHEFDRVLSCGGVGYVQPDPASAGGITTAARVIDLAATAGVGCVPHVWGTAIGLAASLQLIATVPGETMLEFDRTPNPIRQAIVTEPILNDADTVAIPDGPGIGVEVDPEGIEEFRTA